ncbi:MAG: UDP-N-acetylmuramate--L-alanine ligase [Clostridia bacterium]
MISNMLCEGARIHFIGIGGISMSALARILMEDGCIVSGSDSKESNLTKQLEACGAEIFIGHSKEHITNQDIVVHTAAVKSDNPEIIAAKEKGITVIDRAKLLGAIMKRYDVPVAISGTHGKTSTTGMISQIFLTAGKDPTVTIGGELDVIGGNLRVGKKEYFIAEACEYHRSFLQFEPRYSLILNIEADHLDYFKDIDDIIEAFGSFADKTSENGSVIANGDDANVRKALSYTKKQAVTFGVNSDCNYKGVNIQYDKLNCATFDILKNGKHYTTVTLSVPGVHSVYNALAAFATADVCGIDKDLITEALHEFVGAHRRFEKKGYYNNALIVDDYAHHPSEINATLSTASKMDFEKIWCVFQPHTYTRTKMLFNDFVKTFKSNTAKVIITDIYAAREKDTGLISAKDLADEIPGGIYCGSFEEVKDFLRKNISPNELVITMGAGDVYKIGEELLREEM